MPALPNVPLTIAIEIIGNDGGDNDIQNRLYFTYSGSADSTTLNTLLGVVASAWSANIAPLVSNTYKLTGINITDLNSKTGAKVGETVSIAGTQAFPPVTSGAAFVVSGHEALRYRGGHRRIYLAGVPANDLQDPNTWKSTFQAAAAAAWQAFVSAIISAAPAILGALKDVIVHRYGASAAAPVSMPGYRVTKLSVPLTTPITMPITSYSGNPQVGSQRRRNLQAG